MFRFLKSLAWFLTTICFRIKRSGAENIPQSGPVILVCNHLHMMDMMSILAQVRRRVFFMAKKELFENKFLAWLLPKCGAFPIARGEVDVTGIRTAMKHLKDGDLLCIFPEGTRNRERKVLLLPLQDGVAMLALRCKAQIVPSWIEGGYTPWKRTRILTGKPMDLSEFADVNKPTQKEMSALTARIEQAMMDCRKALLDRDGIA